MTAEHLLKRLVAWAAGRETVRAIILTGSRARRDGTADHLSDVDVEIIAEDPAPFMADDDWIRIFGRPVVILPFDPSEDQEWATRLVIYSDGLKADFTLAGPARVVGMVEAGQLDGLYERGYRVLFDRTGLTRGLPEPSGGFPGTALPDQSEFAGVVAEFWFEAAHIPKYLERGELWVVKFRDWTMKELLLRMLEWHAAGTRGAAVDTWHIGTRMQDWVDDATWAEIQGAFGHFNAADAARAFEVTTRLFGRLGRELANRTSLVYPQDVEDGVVATYPGSWNRFASPA